MVLNRATYVTNEVLTSKHDCVISERVSYLNTVKRLVVNLITNIARRILTENFPRTYCVLLRNLTPVFGNFNVIVDCVFQKRTYEFRIAMRK